VSLERGPLSLVSTIEELLGRKRSGSGLESREYGSRDSHADHVAPSIKKFETNFAENLRTPCSIVRSWIHATEFSF
jgi:hypothetical protein